MGLDHATSDGWDDYWQGTLRARSAVEGGVRHPAVKQFWIESLSSLPVDPAAARVLDIGSGDGAMLEHLSAAGGFLPGNVTCVDRSRAAIAALRHRFPGVEGLVADAVDIPLAPESFDVVTSQFGVEYAGPKAVQNSARLVAPGGVLILLLHITEGLMHRECRAALDAIQETEDSNFIALASDMFRAGFAAVEGKDRAPYDEAASRLDAAVRRVEAVLDLHGEHVAGDTIATLYAGVAQIHRELPQYEAQPVLEWLEVMEGELRSFRARMQSMLEAALEETDYASLRGHLEQAGFELDPRRRLDSADGAALGWLICATAAAT